MLGSRDRNKGFIILNFEKSIYALSGQSYWVVLKRCELIH